MATLGSTRLQATTLLSFTEFNSKARWQDFTTRSDLTLDWTKLWCTTDSPHPKERDTPAASDVDVAKQEYSFNGTREEIGFQGAGILHAVQWRGLSCHDISPVTSCRTSLHSTRMLNRVLSLPDYISSWPPCLIAIKVRSPTEFEEWQIPQPPPLPISLHLNWNGKSPPV